MLRRRGVDSAVVSVTFEVSVLVDGEAVDPVELIDAVSTLSSASPLQVERVGNTVRFMAEEQLTLGALAEPLFAWWQRQGPGAVLRLVGPAGGSDISYIAQRRGAGMLRQFIEIDSGPIREADEETLAPRAPRRRWHGRTHGAFTAQAIGVTDEAGILSVGVAEQRGGTGRHLILQSVDPASENAELLSGEEGYCLVTETAATVYGGIKAITLRDRTLLIRLTRTAANELDVPTRLTITLDVEDQALEDLRNGIRQVFSYSSRGGQESPPRLDLA